MKLRKKVQKREKFVIVDKYNFQKVVQKYLEAGNFSNTVKLVHFTHFIDLRTLNLQEICLNDTNLKKYLKFKKNQKLSST